MRHLFAKLFQKIRRVKPTGCIPNTSDDRDLEFRSERTTLPNRIDLSEHTTVVSQGSTSSCVANALGAAIRILESKSGHEYGFPARLWIYWHSRIRHQDLPVKDSGTRIRDACKSLVKEGVPDEKYWPFITSKVNKQPDGYQSVMFADPRKGGEYRAIHRGAGMLANIRKALADGYPVVFGTVVTRSFMKSSGPTMIKRPSGEKSVGRHAMCIVGFATNLNEPGTWFKVQNSWGKRWRDGGFCWMHESYLSWIYSSDFTIVRGWRRIRGES